MTHRGTVPGQTLIRVIVLLKQKFFKCRFDNSSFVLYFADDGAAVSDISTSEGEAGGAAGQDSGGKT